MRFDPKIGSEWIINYGATRLHVRILARLGKYVAWECLDEKYSLDPKHDSIEDFLGDWRQATPINTETL